MQQVVKGRKEGGKEVEESGTGTRGHRLKKRTSPPPPTPRPTRCYTVCLYFGPSVTCRYCIDLDRAVGEA